MIKQILKEILASIRYLLSGIFWYIFLLSEIKNPNSKLPTIVLLHGFFTQNPSLFILKLRLEKLWYKVLLPNFWFHFDPIEKNAKKLDTYIKTHKIQNYIYIWFSIGGIIGLYYKNHYHNSIQKFISIGSPYYGTKMAPFLSFIPSANQVRRNSDFIATLHKKTSSAHNMYSIRAIYDEIIIPSNSAHLLGTTDIVIPEIWHMNLLFSKKTFEAVQKALKT